MRPSTCCAASCWGGSAFPHALLRGCAAFVATPIGSTFAILRRQHCQFLKHHVTILQPHWWDDMLQQEAMHRASGSSKQATDSRAVLDKIWNPGLSDGSTDGK